jgi:hypothetical protein
VDADPGGRHCAGAYIRCLFNQEYEFYDFEDATAAREKTNVSDAVD